MAYSNIFSQSASSEMLKRLDKLTPTSKPIWGKMEAAQMLAHLNVAYDKTYNPGKAPGAIGKMMLKLFVKNAVVSNKPYSKNGRTAPEFVIDGPCDFEKEKARLIENIKKTEQKGIAYFEGKENISFGKLTSNEWSNMFAKHMDHHFQQFGV